MEQIGSPFSGNQYMSVIIIVFSLAGIAIGRIPRLRMNRASIAFAGATFLLLSGAIAPEDALKSIDLGTLILILSMMIITANLKFSGFFDLASTTVLRLAHTPRRLLCFIMGTSALLSALFLNDTICIMMTPLVASLVLRAQRNPLPYLIALAVSANIGSAATIIGNPQNMLIGASSGIPFVRFTGFLWIPSLIGILISYGIVLLVFPKEFFSAPPLSIPGDGGNKEYRLFRPLLYKSGIAIGIMTICFILNMPVYEAAMLGAALLLITRRIKPERVFAELDWTIIAFFGGLFIITAAVACTDVFQFFVEKGMPLVGGNLANFSIFTLLLSNLISNVPAVMLMRPLVKYFDTPEKAWLIMAMASTYAGNLTLLGSVANLIVAEGAKRFGITIRFIDYLKVGVPVTLITIAVGTVWILWI
ncbi:MAG: anion transporter [Treponemataceae bacterium]|nr:anion transporter [Treponemataceae bacterium]